MVTGYLIMLQEGGGGSERGLPGPPGFRALRASGLTVRCHPGLHLRPLLIAEVDDPHVLVQGLRISV